MMRLVVQCAISKKELYICSVYFSNTRSTAELGVNHDVHNSRTLNDLWSASCWITSGACVIARRSRVMHRNEAHVGPLAPETVDRSNTGVSRQQAFQQIDLSIVGRDDQNVGQKLDADWVILSACNTAAGETKGAEALSGLARAPSSMPARAPCLSRIGTSTAMRPSP